MEQCKECEIYRKELDKGHRKLWAWKNHAERKINIMEKTLELLQKSLREIYNMSEEDSDSKDRKYLGTDVTLHDFLLLNPSWGVNRIQELEGVIERAKGND